MTDKETPETNPAPKPEPSKSDTVKRLLSRRTGATTEEMIAATNWQPHSVRAFLSGLRKKGTTIVREERKNGAQAYRIEKPSQPATDQ